MIGITFLLEILLFPPLFWVVGDHVRRHFWNFGRAVRAYLCAVVEIHPFTFKSSVLGVSVFWFRRSSSIRVSMVDRSYRL